MRRPRTVIAPDGTTWTIRRLWVTAPPRWPRLRRLMRLRDVGDIGSLGFGGSDVAGAILGLALFAVLVLVVILLPLLALAVELLIVVVVMAAGVVGRLLLGRPWVIEAIPDTGGRQPISWQVSGWNESRRAIDQVAAGLRAGVEPRAGEGIGQAGARASVPPPGG